MVTVSRKQPSVFPLLLGLYTLFSAGSSLWRRQREGWTVGTAVPGSSRGRFLSIPPLSVWAHLDGWLSLISRGNSSPAAASSSCISTSALTEQLDSRAWNGAWEIRWAYPSTLSWGTSKPSKGREMPIFHPQTTIFFSFSSSSYPFIFSNISMHLVQLETQSSRPHLD